jgi:hypothetical protein
MAECVPFPIALISVRVCLASLVVNAKLHHATLLPHVKMVELVRLLTELRNVNVRMVLVALSVRLRRVCLTTRVLMEAFVQ